MIPKWSQNDRQIIPKWFQHNPKMSPGERAQKVIPGGAKTNEIFWKSQNSVKKINFTFPIICVYYSLGDRAQKVIPGGAKTNESFWKFQNDVKKSILRFPLFLSTVALVIERKKLSPAPEVRKQTRASESLKITSQDQFYIFHHFCLL